MSEECTHNCSTCNKNCSSRDLREQPHSMSSVKKVIGIVSGKGGVGKSLVTSLLSVIMKRRGYNSAILDADITGPSIPKVFGMNKEKAMGDENGIYPVRTATGIDMMSVNLLLEDETEPVIWRGPVIAGTVKQFWTDVIWSDIDWMFVDMPPGTSPQELVSMIVGKAVKMANKMDIPVLGLVENMSYFKCPDCGEEHQIYGDSHIEEVAAQYGIENIARLPIDPKLAAACDKGAIELFDGEWLDAIADMLEKL